MNNTNENSYKLYNFCESKDKTRYMDIFNDYYVQLSLFI